MTLNFLIYVFGFTQSLPLDITLHYYAFPSWWVILETKNKSWNKHYKEKVPRGANFGKYNAAGSMLTISTKYH